MVCTVSDENEDGCKTKTGWKQVYLMDQVATIYKSNCLTEELHCFMRKPTFPLGVAKNAHLLHSFHNLALLHCRGI